MYSVPVTPAWQDNVQHAGYACVEGVMYSMPVTPAWEKCVQKDDQTVPRGVFVGRCRSMGAEGR